MFLLQHNMSTMTGTWTTEVFNVLHHIVYNSTQCTTLEICNKLLYIYMWKLVNDMSFVDVSLGQRVTDVE